MVGLGVGDAIVRKPYQGASFLPAAPVGQARLCCDETWPREKRAAERRNDDARCPAFWTQEYVDD